MADTAPTVFATLSVLGRVPSGWRGGRVPSHYYRFPIVGLPEMEAASFVIIRKYYIISQLLERGRRGAGGHDAACGFFWTLCTLRDSDTPAETPTADCLGPQASSDA